MRDLYLVRHGQVDFPDNIRRCIGRTDVLLSEKGREQGQKLGKYFRHRIAGHVPVFTSPLKRARETAELLAGEYPVYVEDGLKEFHMGEWENMPMSRLKKNLESWPESGEQRKAGLIRMKNTIEHLLARTEGDIICVAHAGVNSCFLADLLKTPLNTSRALPQPYGGFNRIQIDEKGYMEVKELGIMPGRAPDERECADIWDHYKTPDQVRRHCRTVCRQAVIIAEKLNAAGYMVDSEIVRSASLLHDVVRTEKNHAAKGADVVRREGYPAVADVIRRHHDLECSGENPWEEPMWLETAVVYLADKQVEEDRVVTLEERFRASRERCRQADDRQAALAAHEKRWKQAKDIEKVIRWMLGDVPA